ncbi:MAG: hypothetical protein GYA52_08855 [Chloroflexi bacterium]|jgi:uncharacterized membrane protein|nr:hypothetical protein [Chloroflexota bacterium]
MKKRFKFLRTMANIFRILGVIICALSLLGGIILIVLSISNSNFWSLFGYSSYDSVLTVTIGVVALVSGLLTGLITYGYGELIFVFLAIEENTHRTSVFLEEMQKEQD